MHTKLQSCVASPLHFIILRSQLIFLYIVYSLTYTIIFMLCLLNPTKELKSQVQITAIILAFIFVYVFTITGKLYIFYDFELLSNIHLFQIEEILSVWDTTEVKKLIQCWIPHKYQRQYLMPSFYLNEHTSVSSHSLLFYTFLPMLKSRFPAFIFTCQTNIYFLFNTWNLEKHY